MPHDCQLCKGVCCTVAPTGIDACYFCAARAEIEYQEYKAEQMVECQAAVRKKILRWWQ